MWDSVLIFLSGIVVGIIVIVLGLLLGKNIDEKTLAKNLNKEIIKRFNKEEAYIAGSEFDGERYPEDEAVKIK